MEQIRGQLDKLQELSVEQIKSLKSSVLSEFGTVEAQGQTREAVEAMTELADAHDLILAEEERRASEEAELGQLAADAASRVRGAADEADEVAASEDVQNGSEASSTPPAEKKEDDEEDEDKDGKKSKKPTFKKGEKPEFSVEEPEALTPDVTDEAELSVEVADEEPVVNEEAQLSVETPEAAELSVETVDETPAADAEAEPSAADTTPESEEEPVTASTTPEFNAPAENAPVAVAEKATVTITAAADLQGYPMGSKIPNLRSVAQAILDRRKGMSRISGGDGEHALVASLSHESFYDASHTLASNDFEGNREKIEKALAPEALVAAGGLYGPVDTSRDIYELGETLGRPVKDSLPSFNADRGGLRFMTPPILTDLNGAVSVWTLQDDIDAVEDGGPVKPCIRVEAGVEVTVYIEAMPLCLTFGNIGARAYPELVERHTRLAMVWQARFAETRLLTRIGQLSTSVTAAGELGAARDILVQVEKAAAALRNRHRLDAEAPLKALFPVWFKNALRADLVKQLPGDGQDVAFNLVDASINKWFAARDINITWFIDGEAGQIMGEQAEGTLNGFPTDVIWYLFPEGTFLFLDGGTLDLGLVRDSTLNATNDYKLFLETFENVAKVGVESLRITSKVLIAGASAATVDTIA